MATVRGLGLLFYILLGFRCREYIQHLAGSRLRPELHATLPLSYWIVEISFGKAPTPATIGKMGSNLSRRFDRNHMEDDIEHCGMTQFRICVFHMSSLWLMWLLPQTQVLNLKPETACKYLFHICNGNALRPGSDTLSDG